MAPSWEGGRPQNSPTPQAGSGHGVMGRSEGWGRQVRLWEAQAEEETPSLTSCGMGFVRNGVAQWEYQALVWGKGSQLSVPWNL